MVNPNERGTGRQGLLSTWKGESKKLETQKKKKTGVRQGKKTGCGGKTVVVWKMEKKRGRNELPPAKN